jgi:hypothetical protein
MLHRLLRAAVVLAAGSAFVFTVAAVALCGAVGGLLPVTERDGPSGQEAW